MGRCIEAIDSLTEGRLQSVSMVNGTAEVNLKGSLPGFIT